MLTLRNDEFAKALAKSEVRRACELANSSQTFELALAIDHVLASDDIAAIFRYGDVARGPARYVRS